MAKEFVEKGTFVHEGKEFTAGGAYVVGEHAAGYPKKVEGVLKLFSWDGQKVLGTGKVTRCWPTPRSFLSSKMCQMEFDIGGHTYTGRGAGEGMLWRGKMRKARIARRR